MAADPATTLLSAFAGELSAMTAMVESLSALVAEHVRQSSGQDRALALVEGQTIDDLSQRLHALSDVAAAVSRGEDLAAALDAVPLADLSQRLRGAVPHTPADRPASGELMLFE